jgi:hypothetical protein
MALTWRRVDLYCVAWRKFSSLSPSRFFVLDCLQEKSTKKAWNAEEGILGTWRRLSADWFFTVLSFTDSFLQNPASQYLDKIQEIS